MARLGAVAIKNSVYVAPLIIHDIDVKDGKFARVEAPGVAAVIAGIAVAEREDEARIAVGARMFEALLQLFRRKRG